MSSISDKKGEYEGQFPHIPEITESTSSSIPEGVFDGVKAGVIAALASLAVTLSPISPAQASPITTAPVSGPQKAGANPLLTNVALNNGVNYDTPINTQTLQPGLQQSLKELSDRLRTGQREGILSIELLEDPKLRTGIKGPEELGKRIPNADRKTITLGSVETLTGFNLDAVLSDMRTKLGKMSSEELQGTLSGQFINKIYEPIITNDKSQEGPKRRTFNNLSNKGWTNKVYMDGQMAINESIKLFEEQVKSLESRGLLSPDMLFYAWIDATGIAFQSSLKYKEQNKEVVFTGDKGVDQDHIDTGRNYWIDGRKNYADAVANYQLVTDPNSRVLVYTYRVTSVGGKTHDVQLLVPITDQDLGRQSIQYGLLAPKRGDLIVFLDTAGSEKRVEVMKGEIQASKQRTAESAKREKELDIQIALLEQYNEITRGKKVEEIKPSLPKLIQIRDAYAKAPGAEQKVLGQMNMQIAMLGGK